MAEQDRTTTDSIVDLMADRPFTFDFFQSVRALETEFRDRPRVGTSTRLDQDFIRFCQEPSLSFAPSTLRSVVQRHGLIRIFVNFLGMFGPNGPLPQHLTVSGTLTIRPSPDSWISFTIACCHSFTELGLATKKRSISTGQKNRAMQSSTEVFLGSDRPHYAIGTRCLTLPKFISPDDWLRLLATPKVCNRYCRIISVFRQRSRNFRPTG